MSSHEKRHSSRSGSMQGHRKHPNCFTDASSNGSFMDETDREVSNLTDRAFRSLCIGEEAIYNDSEYCSSPTERHKAFAENSQTKTVSQEKSSNNVQQHAEANVPTESGSTFQNSCLDSAQQELGSKQGSLSYLNSPKEETWQQNRSSSRVSSLIKAFSSGECYQDSGTCDVILARDRYREFCNESLDKSSLLRIQKDFSEFTSGIHQNVKISTFQPHKNSFDTSEMAATVAHLDTTVLLKSSKSKFNCVNSTNAFFHSEFSPFQLWEEYSLCSAEKTFPGFLSANELPRWYDSPVYKELKDTHTLSSWSFESKHFGQRQVQDFVPNQRSRSTVTQKASAVEKRCESEMAANCPPWKKSYFIRSKIPSNRPSTVSPNNDKSYRLDSSVHSMNKVTQETVVNNSLSSRVTPFNITQLLTPVINTRQETETSEIVQMANTPSISEYSSQGEYDSKSLSDVKHLRDSYKSRASSLLFNLKDNRKRVKSTYSPTKFKGSETPDRIKQTSKLDEPESSFSDILVSQEAAQENLIGADTGASCNQIPVPNAATMTYKDYTDDSGSHLTLTSPQIKNGTANHSLFQNDLNSQLSKTDLLAKTERIPKDLPFHNYSTERVSWNPEDLHGSFSPGRPEMESQRTISRNNLSQHDLNQKDAGRKTHFQYSRNDQSSPKSSTGKNPNLGQLEPRPVTGEIAALIKMDKQRKATAKQYLPSANNGSSVMKETYMQKVNEDIKLGRLAIEEETVVREGLLSVKTSYNDNQLKAFDLYKKPKTNYQTMTSGSKENIGYNALILKQSETQADMSFQSAESDSSDQIKTRDPFSINDILSVRDSEQAKKIKENVCVLAKSEDPQNLIKCDLSTTIDKDQVDDSSLLPRFPRKHFDTTNEVSIRSDRKEPSINKETDRTMARALTYKEKGQSKQEILTSKLKAYAQKEILAIKEKGLAKQGLIARNIIKQEAQSSFKKEITADRLNHLFQDITYSSVTQEKEQNQAQSYTRNESLQSKEKPPMDLEYFDNHIVNLNKMSTEPLTTKTQNISSAAEFKENIKDGSETVGNTTRTVIKDTKTRTDGDLMNMEDSTPQIQEQSPNNPTSSHSAFSAKTSNYTSQKPSSLIENQTLLLDQNENLLAKTKPSSLTVDSFPSTETNSKLLSAENTKAHFKLDTNSQKNIDVQNISTPPGTSEAHIQRNQYADLHNQNRTIAAEDQSKNEQIKNSHWITASQLASSSNDLMVKNDISLQEELDKSECVNLIPNCTTSEDAEEKCGRENLGDIEAIPELSTDITTENNHKDSDNFSQPTKQETSTCLDTEAREGGNNMPPKMDRALFTKHIYKAHEAEDSSYPGQMFSKSNLKNSSDTQKTPSDTMNEVDSGLKELSEPTGDITNTSDLTASKEEPAEEPMIYNICVSSKTEVGSDDEPMIYTICVSSKYSIDENDNIPKQVEQSSDEPERYKKDEGIRVKSEKSENMDKGKASNDCKDTEAQKHEIKKRKTPTSAANQSGVGTLSTSYDDLLVKYGFKYETKSLLTSPLNQDDSKKKENNGSETTMLQRNIPLDSSRLLLKEKNSDYQTHVNNSSPTPCQATLIGGQSLKERDSTVENVKAVENKVHKNEPFLTTKDAASTKQKVEESQNVKATKQSMNDGAQMKGIEEVQLKGHIDSRNYPTVIKNVSPVAEQTYESKSTDKTNEVFKKTISEKSVLMDTMVNKVTENTKRESKLPSTIKKTQMRKIEDNTLSYDFNTSTQNPVQCNKNSELSSTAALKKEPVSIKPMQSSENSYVEKKSAMPEKLHGFNTNKQMANRMTMVSSNAFATDNKNHMGKVRSHDEDVCSAIKRDQDDSKVPGICSELINAFQEKDPSKTNLVDHKQQSKVKHNEIVKQKSSSPEPEKDKKIFSEQSKSPVKPVMSQIEPKIELTDFCEKISTSAHGKEIIPSPNYYSKQEQFLRQVGENNQSNFDKRLVEVKPTDMSLKVKSNKGINENSSRLNLSKQNEGFLNVDESKSIREKKERNVMATEKQTDRNNTRDSVPEKIEKTAEKEQETARFNQEVTKREGIQSKAEDKERMRKASRPELSALADYARLKVICAEEESKDTLLKNDFYKRQDQSVSRNVHISKSDIEREPEAKPTKQDNYQHLDEENTIKVQEMDKEDPIQNNFDQKTNSLHCIPVGGGSSDSQKNNLITQKTSNAKSAVLEQRLQQKVSDFPQLKADNNLSNKSQIPNMDAIRTATCFNGPESQRNVSLSATVKQEEPQQILNTASSGVEELDELQYYTVNALDREINPTISSDAFQKITHSKDLEDPRKEDNSFLQSLADYGKVHGPRPRSNSSSPALGKPTLFKVKDNTIRGSSVTKTVKPLFHKSFFEDSSSGIPKDVSSNPENSDFCFDLLEPRNSTRLLENVEPLQTTFSLTDSSATQSSANSRSNQVVEDDETQSVISTTSEATENSSIRHIATFMAKNENFKNVHPRPASACYERPQSACYDRPESACSDLRPFGKPPAVPPKSEKALRRAQRLTTRRMKKNELKMPERLFDSEPTNNTSSEPLPFSDTQPADQAQSPLSQYELQPSYSQHQHLHNMDGQPIHGTVAQPAPIMIAQSLHNMDGQPAQSKIAHPKQNVDAQTMHHMDGQPIHNTVPQPLPNAAAQPVPNMGEQLLHSKIVNPGPNLDAQLALSIDGQQIQGKVSQHLPNLVALPVPIKDKQPLHSKMVPPGHNCDAHSVPGIDGQQIYGKVTQPVPNMVVQPVPNMVAQPVSNIERQPMHSNIAQTVPSMVGQSVPSLVAQPLLQKRLLQDPNSGQYFMVDMPLPVKTKTFYDPETGKYVELNVRHKSQRSKTHPTSVEMLNTPYMLYHGFLPMAVPSLQPLSPSPVMSAPSSVPDGQRPIETSSKTQRPNHSRDSQQHPDIVYRSYEKISDPHLYAEEDDTNSERTTDIITMSELEDFAMESS